MGGGAGEREREREKVTYLQCPSQYSFDQEHIGCKDRLQGLNT
jgi:hypothetical protein